MVGNGYELGYVMKVTGTGIQRCYSRIVYPLPSLIAEHILACDYELAHGLTRWPSEAH
jgi:hypothetical protein